MIRKLLTALTVSAVFVIASCTDGTLKTSSRTSRPDPSWVTAISLHSNGAISRHSPIRVLFTSDVIAAERVGADASGNIRIQPDVKSCCAPTAHSLPALPIASRCWPRD